MERKASICITARLSEEQKREIEALGRACRAWEAVTQEPFTENEENADPALPCFYIYYENTYPISFLSLFIPDGRHAEVTGFTLPGYRKKGCFRELLDCARRELSDRALTWHLVSDGKSGDAMAMIRHMNLEKSHSEMMMAAPLEHLTGLEARAKAEKAAVIRAEEECLLKSGERILGRCRLAYFPGIVYLYSFEIAEEERRKGYGRLFLKLLAESQKEGIHTMLLQVGSGNEAACRLYGSCGFTVTEQLDYYPVG